MSYMYSSYQRMMTSIICILTPPLPALEYKYDIFMMQEIIVLLVTNCLSDISCLFGNIIWRTELRIMIS